LSRNAPAELSIAEQYYSMEAGVTPPVPQACFAVTAGPARRAEEQLVRRDCVSTDTNLRPG
ncbi:MAG TPA: hypothetical protein VN345_09435, partial [Blastocatellia bacterium]|nr:hypothetical protein [Blastocatellia bacterium]